MKYVSATNKYLFLVVKNGEGVVAAPTNHIFVVVRVRSRARISTAASVAFIPCLLYPVSSSSPTVNLVERC